jgi:uncharacterized protein
MSQQEFKALPIRFDPVNFANHDKEMHGRIVSKTMSRLMSNVSSAEPMVTAKLSFSRGLYGYPLVSGQAWTTVFMRCERCLDEVAINLSPKIEVLVRPEEDSLSEKNENVPEFHEYDGKSLVLSDLIEEELLLALPLVPKHQDISLCNQDMLVWLAANEALSEGQDAPDERAENPFAILKR